MLALKPKIDSLEGFISIHVADTAFMGERDLAIPYIEIDVADWAMEKFIRVMKEFPSFLLCGRNQGAPTSFVRLYYSPTEAALNRVGLRSAADELIHRYKGSALEESYIKDLRKNRRRRI